MKLEQIFTDQNKPADPVLQELIHHSPLQIHDIVMQGIIPLPQEFNYRIFQRVIYH
ncbi:hypothetical protein D9M69_573880 [compost metagenome]